jgi:superfamily II DNA or RNA helicase
LWLSSYQGHLIGLTGTPPKYTNSERGRLFNQHIPQVYTYITDQAVEDKILNDYQIFIHKVRLSTKQNIKAGKAPKTFYTSEQANYTYWTNRCITAKSPKDAQISRIMRMKAMMSFKSKEEYAKALLYSIEDKIILFANTHDQADCFGIPSYHSNNSNSKYNLEDFKKGTINQLACVLQLSEGINIPNLKQGIIMHAYSGGSAKSQQRFGRLLRLNPNEKCTLHILCYADTVDEDWIKSCLENLNQSKIKWVQL